ncbi:MAG: ChaN family lipoprotein [Sneathiella sp.]|nr:ChaN family lipoprotein [Sneathiella sp.]
MTTRFDHPANTWIDGRTGRQHSADHVTTVCTDLNIILLGETHDRADHHHWQLDISQKLLNQHRKIALGFEMFPKQLQSILDQWTAGAYTDEQFLKKTEWDKIWGFDPSLYMPLFQFCKHHQIPMIALNCDRQLVRDIGKLGWDGVENSRLEELIPAKPATAEYRQYLFDVTGGPRPDRKAKNAEDPAFDRFVRAQQVWDRAFACNLSNYYEKHPDTLLIGIIGSGHLEFGGGTPYQLDDLGLNKHSVLLPSDEPEIPEGIADFIYRLPTR